MIYSVRKVKTFNSFFKLNFIHLQLIPMQNWSYHTVVCWASRKLCITGFPCWAFHLETIREEMWLNWGKKVSLWYSDGTTLTNMFYTKPSTPCWMIPGNENDHFQLKDLNNETFCSYQGNATRLSRLMKDEMIPGKDRAVYWVEHVLRHGGAKHLQLSSKNMPFYQKYLLDVWLFLALIGVIIGYLFILFLRFTFICMSKPSKQKTQ